MVMKCQRLCPPYNAKRQRSAQVRAHAGVVEELDTVEFEGSPDGVKITAARARYNVEFFRPRDRGFRHAAELGKILY